LAVARAPAFIRSAGLGSCVGIVLYEPFINIGGLAHAMLPRCRPGREDSREKYVDTSVHLMLEKLLGMGAIRENIVAKLAGGAQMFSRAESDLLVIGSKNIIAAGQVLSELGIPIIAQDVGGNHGRTLEFNCSDGALWIRTLQGETKI